MKHIDAIKNWNNYCKANKLEILPRPGSEQDVLRIAADEATKYFDSLTATTVDGDTILVDGDKKFRYVFDDGFEHYEEVTR